MIDLTGISHNPHLEELVSLLCKKTQNTDRSFFRAEVAFFFGKVASNMRASVVTKDRGETPVNIYTLALATSGFGKGHSVNIMENDVLGAFRKRFVDLTFEEKAEDHLLALANAKAAAHGTDPDVEHDYFLAQFKGAGAYPFTFDSATVPAVKQLRHKLLLANAGAVSLQIDEIGSNLLSSVELLTLFLELYDQGMVKQKLTKNTSENQRAEEVDGKTPTNMLLFGTPARLFDGGQTEDHFYSLLETGYSRRCIYGYGLVEKQSHNVQTALEVYKNLTSPENSATVTKWSQHFEDLADPSLFDWKMNVSDDVAVKLIEYRLACERAAEALSEHEEIQKAELSHRYYKALKLAGAYAFIDQSLEVTMEHLLQAILLVEESGEAFKRILKRERPYVRLVKFVATADRPLSHPDLIEALPFFKGSSGQRNEQIALATAWGYTEHIVIKKSYVDGIEFLEGETLENTDLDKMLVSISKDWAQGYGSMEMPFDKLRGFGTNNDYNFCTHAFTGQHRSEENAIPGFNMVVIDVDGEVKIDEVQKLLQDYRYIIYTTKRHTNEENRFRLLMPINYKLKLDREDFKEFMHALYDWLPFKVDQQAVDRSRKWATWKGQVFFNEGDTLVDALPFIPRTSKNDQRINQIKELRSLGNLERWFAGKFTSGNRNNTMLCYAMALVDSGLDLQTVKAQVVSFNSRLRDSLTEAELNSTVFASVAKRYLTT